MASVTSSSVVWDTPFKRTISPTNVGGNDTGIWGTACLLTAGSTTHCFGDTLARELQASPENIDQLRQPELRRLPGDGGVTRRSTARPRITTAAGNSKPRVLSHRRVSTAPVRCMSRRVTRSTWTSAVRSVSAPVPARRTRRQRLAHRRGLHLGSGALRRPVHAPEASSIGTLGGAPTLESRVSAWHVGVDWRIVGPHGLRAAYTQAGDVKGDAGRPPAVAGSQGQTRTGVIAGNANDTGADMFQIRYVYTFSKRTEFTFGYVKLDNDGNATTNGGLHDLRCRRRRQPGNNQDAWAWACATRSKLAASSAKRALRRPFFLACARSAASRRRLLRDLQVERFEIARELRRVEERRAVACCGEPRPHVLHEARVGREAQRERFVLVEGVA